jgi:hypothetical protein
MLRTLAAATVALSLSGPVLAQQAGTAPATVQAEAPIAVPENAPAGSSGPTAMGVASGSAAAIVIIGVGLVIACGIACAN